MALYLKMRFNETNSTETLPDVTSERTQAEKDDMVAWIAGCTVFVVLVFAFATVQWYRKKKLIQRTKRAARLKKRTKEKEKEKSAIKRVSISSIKSEEFVHHFRHHMLKKSSGSLEYQLKAVASYSTRAICSIGVLACNIDKNFQTQYLPFDHNRVCLNCNENDSTTDYINASYVSTNQSNSASNESLIKRYIAAQNPLPSTVTDFWQMIWQEECLTVVMLTDVFTYSGRECAEYWNVASGLYGNISVKLDSIHKTLHHTIRKFVISKVGCEDTERVVHQFQFHGWSSELLPDVAGLLEFRRKIKLFTENTASPIIVHSRTGSGRTGAYITLDLVLEKLDKDDRVDILGTIIAIRRYRPNFVINTVQLETVYEAVCLYILCETTVIPLKSISVSALQTKEEILESKQVDHQYKLFNIIIPKLTVVECASGHLIENKDKSRDIMLQPPERARPHLRTFDLNEHSDFINAIYVDGHRYKNQYIIGQWPVRSSINDFWRLVLDDQITATVVLHSMQSTGRNYPTFWPTAHCSSARYGPVRVTVVKTAETTDYTIRTFSVRKYVWNPAESFLSKDFVTIRLIFLKHWPDGDDEPKSWQPLINLMSVNQKWGQKLGLSFKPIFIMSKDGVKRAGVYSALSICVDQITKDDEVDVFSAVKSVKYNRPQAVTKAEYELLYSIITRYIKSKLPAPTGNDFISQELHVTAVEEFELLRYTANLFSGPRYNSSSKNDLQVFS